MVFRMDSAREELSDSHWIHRTVVGGVILAVIKLEEAGADIDALA
jgi:hypothetical protein